MRPSRSRPTPTRSMLYSIRGRRWRVRRTRPARARTTTARSFRYKATSKMRSRRRSLTRPMSTTRTCGATRSPAPERKALGIVSETVNGGPAASRPSVGAAHSVWKAFGETQALRDVSLDVGAGECHGLVGRNGAGKSTLVAVLTGLIRPDRGTVRLGWEAAPGQADRAPWQRLGACVYQQSLVVATLIVAVDSLLDRWTGERPNF